MIGESRFFLYLVVGKERLFLVFVVTHPLPKSFLPLCALYILIIFIILCDNTLSIETHNDH